MLLLDSVQLQPADDDHSKQYCTALIVKTVYSVILLCVFFSHFVRNAWLFNTVWRNFVTHCLDGWEELSLWSVIIVLCDCLFSFQFCYEFSCKNVAMGGQHR